MAEETFAGFLGRKEVLGRCNPTGLCHHSTTSTDWGMDQEINCEVPQALEMGKAAVCWVNERWIDSLSLTDTNLESGNAPS